MIETNFLIVFIRSRFVISKKRKNTRKKPKPAEKISLLTGMILFSV